jgi:O-antigen/teichoic acid export membrane protein
LSTQTKIASSFGWATISSYLNRITGFVATLILARLLAPEEFGLVAVAAMMIEVLKIFRDMGIAQAIVYRQTEVREAADTAFVVVVLLNVGLVLIAVAASPLLANYFFDDPKLMPILIVMASNLIPAGIRSIPEALIRKEMRFDKLMIPDVAPAMVSAVVGVVMAYAGFGVWSLVARTVVATLLGTIMIWWFTDYRPKWRFNRRIAGELYGYGKFIVGTMLLNVALYNIDKVYIGKFGGIAELGIYTMAWVIASIPVSEFGHMLCRVAFPAFCRVNQNPEELRRVFLNTFRYNCLAVMPLGFGIIFFGKDLVQVFLGDKWSGVGVALAILAGAALCRAVSTLIHEALRAVAAVKANQQFILLRLIIVGGFGIPALNWGGLPAMCALVLIGNLAALSAEMWYVNRKLQLGFGQLMRSFLPPLTIASLTIGACFAVYSQIPGAHDSLWITIAGSLVAAALYAGCVALVDRSILADARALFRGGQAQQT